MLNRHSDVLRANTFPFFNEMLKPKRVGHLVAWTILLLSPFLLAVENHTVELQFFAKGSGDPLSLVEVKAQATTLFSDDSGNLKMVIQGDSDGEITVSKSGFETKRISAKTLLENETLKVYLFPALGEDSLVVIQGDRSTSPSRKTVTITEAKSVAPGGDPAQVVKLLPGVQSGVIAQQIVIRGSGPNDSLFLFDNTEVPFIFHSIGNISIVPTPLLSDVQFESGGFDSQYGDATGGVVVLKTKNEIPEKRRVSFTLNLPIYSGLYYEQPIDEKSFFAVSLRRSYLDIFINLYLQNNKDEAGGLVVAPNFGDLYLTHFRKDDSGYTKSTLIGAEDGIKAVVPTDFSANENGSSSFSFLTSFASLSVERQHRLSSEWLVNTTPQLYYYVFESNILNNKNETIVTRMRLPTQFTHPLTKGVKVNLGLDPSIMKRKNRIDSVFANFGGSDRKSSFEDAQKVQITQSQTLEEMAGWASLEAEWDNIKINPSFRTFYDSQIKRAGADSRVRAKYAIDRKHTLKGAVGQYSKGPEANQAAPDIGNPDLTYERSIHYILGVESKWNDLWTTELSAYYKTIDDVIESDPTKKFTNSGKIRSQGVEVFIRRNLSSRMFGWLSYTYSQTKETDPALGEFFFSDYDQTHVANLVASYKLSPFWDISGRYNYHTGDVYTPVSMAFYDAQTDSYLPRQDPYDKNSQRLPNFNSASLYLTKNFLMNLWTLALRFGVESYWPKPQVMGMQNSYNYKKTEHQTGLPAIPFIELSGEF